MLRNKFVDRVLDIFRHRIGIIERLRQLVVEARNANLMMANAITEDVATGYLVPEQTLAPQRKHAEALGHDYTAIARAYTGRIDGD